MIRKKHMKNMAAVMAAAMVLSAAQTAGPVFAAEAPANGTNLSIVYYGKNTKYAKTIKNVKKGYVVKFSAAGEGAAYISFSSSKVTASGKTASTTVKIKKAAVNDHAGKTAAKIVAKVYTGAGKLVKTVNDNVTIAEDASKIAIKTAKMDLSDLVVGGAYDFDRTLTPTVSSNKTYWSVEDANGNDCSSMVDSQGVFRPTKAGIYIVTATARRSRNALDRASKSITISVKDDSARVASVAPKNAGAVDIVFSESVSKISAENIDNYSIGGVKPVKAVLGSDERTVTLTFTTAEYSKKVLIVEPITTKADSKVQTELYISVYTYTDQTAPQVLSVEAVTAQSSASGLTITASEPIASGTVKVDGSAVNGVWEDDTFTASGLNLTASSSHTLQIVNLRDKSSAGNTAALIERSFTVKVDNTAPTAVLRMEDDRTIKVVFSKKMNPDTVLSALGTLGSVTDSASSVIPCTAAVVAGGGQKEFTLTIQDNGFYALGASRTVLVKFTSSITDYLGNPMTQANSSVTMVKDTKAPVFTSAAAIKNENGQVVSLVFTADKDLEKLSDGYPSIMRSDGVSYSYSSFLGGLTAPLVSGNKLTYSLVTPQAAGGSYTFTIPAGVVKDTALGGNANASQVLALDFGSAEIETGFKVTAAEASAKNVIDVTFTAAAAGGSMAGSATDASHYTLNGNSLPAGTTIVLTDDGKRTARITLPNASVSKTDEKAILVISGIVSTNGTALTSCTTTVPIYDNTAPAIASAKFNAVDAGKSAAVRVTYNEAVVLAADTTKAADEFSLMIGGAEVKAASISRVAGSDTMLDIVFETELSVSQATLKSVGNRLVTDAEGNAQAVNTAITVQAL